jgi:hypothetical protein
VRSLIRESPWLSLSAMPGVLPGSSSPLTAASIVPPIVIVSSMTMKWWRH